MVRCEPELPALRCGTHYYWEIIAKDACGRSDGPVWEFITVACKIIFLPMLLRRN